MHCSASQLIISRFLSLALSHYPGLPSITVPWLQLVPPSLSLHIPPGAMDCSIWVPPLHSRHHCYNLLCHWVSWDLCKFIDWNHVPLPLSGFSLEEGTFPVNPIMGGTKTRFTNTVEALSTTFAVCKRIVRVVRWL